MYLSPSSIHFTNCTGQTAIHEITNENDIEMLSRKFVEKKEILPKIQVVQKEGHYFTLNNTQLQVFRWLEQEGYCHNVKAEVIAIKRIPLPIRQMMTLPPSEEEDDDDDDEDKQGYSKESHNVGKHGSQSDTSNDDNDEDDDDSLSSYSLESNSGNDASDIEDEDADSDEESSTDASTEEELEEERESLL